MFMGILRKSNRKNEVLTNIRQKAGSALLQIWICQNNVFCIYTFNNYNENVIDVTTFLKNWNCTACCEKENNAKVLSDDAYNYLPICSMEYSAASEDNLFSASQLTPQILWNTNVHQYIHTCLSPVPILNQLDPVHAAIATSVKSILIFSCYVHLGLSCCLFPSGFCTKTLYTLIVSPICATCTAHLKVLNLITRTILCEQHHH